MQSIALVLFVVFLVLWLVSIVAPPSGPYANGRAIVAWLTVLFLALAAHVVPL